MRFIHYEVSTRNGDVIHVTLRGSEANVQVMDDLNFSHYRSGRQYRFFGGHFKRSPVNIPAPSAGKWNVVVDLGGYGGHVEAAVQVLSTVLA
jgi:hypothetical protein